MQGMNYEVGETIDTYACRIDEVNYNNSKPYSYGSITVLVVVIVVAYLLKQIKKRFG